MIRVIRIISVSVIKVIRVISVTSVIRLNIVFRVVKNIDFVIIIGLLWL